MKANELRLGNLISNMYEKTARVREIREHSLWAGGFVIITDRNSSAIDTLQPIPLTAEWLENFGFRTSGPKLLFLPIPNHKIEIHYEMQPYGNIVTLQSDFGMLIPNDIQYIHQLQNLFFALTGEELNMKEETK